MIHLVFTWFSQQGTLLKSALLVPTVSTTAVGTIRLDGMAKHMCMDLWDTQEILPHVHLAAIH
jgi:hypothetical protein